MSRRQLPERPATQGISQREIDQRVFDLYDEYCHGRMDRREFLSRAASIAAVGGSGLAMAEAPLPRRALQR
jgi:carboxymethylenebutenolidase